MDPSIAFPPMAGNQPASKQLDFKQSMDHFQTMFPDLDKAVIETVLRSNNGAVDSTIDQLLQISEGQDATRTNLPPNPPSYDTASAQPSDPYNLSKNLNINSEPIEKVQKRILKNSDLMTKPTHQQNQLIDFDTTDAQACTSSPKNSSKFNPPLVGPLPNDFLRISSTNSEAQSTVSNQNVVRQSNTASVDHQINHQLLRKKMEENERQRLSLHSNIDDKEIAQYLQDERIAIMLQNQEFVDELRRNKEFMSALNYDAMNHNTRVKAFQNENQTGQHGWSESTAQNFSDADFKERIRKMGEMSKKKFAQLAGLFSRRAKGSGLPSRDNLLLGDQYAQLENDCSDSEEYGQKKPVNANRPH